MCTECNTAQFHRRLTMNALGRHRFAAIGGLVFVCTVVSTAAYAQEDLRELLVRQWGAYSPEGRAAFVAGGLVRADAESKALALAGIARLAGETPDVARRRFDPDDVRSHFSDSDADVVKEALHAYRLLVTDDARAESAIVERAQQGGGPLKDSEYIRHLRPQGISSDAAAQWLLDLAQGPISPAKFSAAEALVIGLEVPPPSLLPEVMELIRSAEYFCRFNLIQSLPKFGPAAGAYLGELTGLRQRLVEQAALPSRNRSVTMVEPAVDVVDALDKAMSALK
jgi:hypothetical protein